MKIIITEQQLSQIINEVRNKPGDRDKIYQDENIVVVAPLTHTSSCKYGAHTKWCVSVPSNPEHFNQYMKHGVLIYFIIRSPYKNTNKPEYKFAYYHPFDNNGEEYKGWYDMSDNQLSFKDGVDQNLIKFLIPDEVFNMVKDYIKTQKPIWKEKVKKSKIELVDKIKNDPKNKENIIVDDKDWLIIRLDDGFDYIFDEMMTYIYTEPSLQMTILYINKKTYNMYSQRFVYYKDIRNKNVSEHLIIRDVNNDVETNKINNIYEKYYPKIEKQYFKDRKKFYNPQTFDNVYLSPEDVEVGDKVNKDYVIIRKYNDPQTNRIVFDGIDSHGREYTNIHYNDSVGVGVKYDKERHNPI
jgi:hypothetical protein